MVSAQLVAHIGWHGILALGGILPLLLAVALLWVLPDSPAGGVADCRRRPSPERSALSPASATSIPISGLDEPAAGPKGSIGQLFVGRQLAITLMLCGVLYEPADYLFASWMPTLLNHRGMISQHVSWVTAAFQIGGTMGAFCSAS